jgi:UDP-N-acetylmuramate--alanine ligase
MLKVHAWQRVHLVGIGGINMSAVAKLLLAAGAKVTGSDIAETDITKELAAKGVTIDIGPHDERHVPADCQAVIHTSAAPTNNPERIAAKNRHLPDVSNFEWLGAWFKEGYRVVLVTGTHGKSTTTALLGNMCIQAGLDPTVIVGSRLADWPDANLRLGKSDLVIIEGDEYATHFLEFHPAGLIVNNIELDHTDIFRDLDDMRHAFERLLRQTKHGSPVVVNGESAEAMKAVAAVKLHTMKIIRFGRRETIPFPSQAYEAITDPVLTGNERKIGLEFAGGKMELKTRLMGSFNAMNITAAAVMAKELGASDQAIAQAVEGFKGLWRRMEPVGEVNGAQVYSDYGHHPTAVRETLTAARLAFPDKRLVLCFQPHHKNRTRHLFDGFLTCFDQADVLVLCEIYDVAGRSASEDSDVTSQGLLEAIRNKAPDPEALAPRRLGLMEYAPDPAAAVARTLALLEAGDVCIVMGAGDIDSALRNQLITNNV